MGWSLRCHHTLRGPEQGELSAPLWLGAHGDRATPCGHGAGQGLCMHLGWQEEEEDYSWQYVLFSGEHEL